MTWTWPNGSTKIRPIITPITGYFGPRKSISTPNGNTGTFHTGVDFIGFSTVKSVGPGVVIYSAKNSTYGNEVRIDHGNFISRYCHLKDGYKIAVGERVDGGTVVGTMGNTGMSKGVHLHLRFDRNGTPFDPLPYLKLLIASNKTQVAPQPTIPYTEEDEMKSLQMHYTENGKVMRLMFTPGTSWYIEWTEGGSSIANGFAKQLTGNSVAGTKSMRDEIVEAAQRVAAGK